MAGSSFPNGLSVIIIPLSDRMSICDMVFTRCHGPAGRRGLRRRRLRILCRCPGSPHDKYTKKQEIRIAHRALFLLPGVAAGYSGLFLRVLLQRDVDTDAGETAPAPSLGFRDAVGFGEFDRNGLCRELPAVGRAVGVGKQDVRRRFNGE